MRLGLGLSLTRGGGSPYGPELVVNGDFSAGSTGWTMPAEVTVSGGKAVATNGTVLVVQTGSLTPGDTALITVDVAATAGANLRFCNADTTNTNVKKIWTLTVDGAERQLTHQFTVDNAHFLLEADGALFTGTLDNISIRKVIA
jgi:hypothetical protein